MSEQADPELSHHDASQFRQGSICCNVVQTWFAHGSDTTGSAPDTDLQPCRAAVRGVVLVCEVQTESEYGVCVCEVIVCVCEVIVCARSSCV